MYYAGIDIAKHNHEASIIDTEGKSLLDSISFSNTKEGCDKLLSLLERLDIDRESVIIGMEATGHYWLSVYEYLTERVFDVKVTQSGEFTGTKQKISKRGSPYLRRVIWLAASRAAVL